MGTRTRSPNYPAIGLPGALELLQKLWGAIQRSPAPREDIATGMGYSGLHGKSATAVSALRKYGLLERAGADLRISERGMMCLHPESPQERMNAIQEAASEPELFATLTSRFPGGRSNEGLLRNYLLRNNFSTAAASHALLAYRETMDLVDREYANCSPDPAESEKEVGQTPHDKGAVPDAGSRSPNPSLQGTPFRAEFDGIALKGSFHLTTPEEIDTLVKFLQVNKVMIAPVQSAMTTVHTNDEEDHGAEAQEESINPPM